MGIHKVRIVGSKPRSKYGNQLKDGEVGIDCLGNIYFASRFSLFCVTDTGKSYQNKKGANEVYLNLVEPGSHVIITI